MKKYKIIGKPLTHDEMVEIAKAKEPRLYAIAEDKVVGVKVSEIYIDLDTRQWTFKFEQEDYFEDEEPIFKSRTSAEKYLRRL